MKVVSLLHETLHKIARQAKNLQEAEKQMNKAGIPTYGIEFISEGNSSIGYVNRGETYAVTICQDEKTETFFVDSYGDWVEQQETEEEEEYYS
jgi:hypothetical protein